MDVLCFTKRSISPNELGIFQIPNFCLAGYYCRKRESQKSPAYRGSCIYLRNNIDSISMTEFKEHSVENVFKISVVHLPVLKMILLCIYRPPTKRAADYILFLETLEITLIKIINRSFESIVVCGDFNIDFLVQSCEKEQFLSIINFSSLDITIKVSTR